MGQGKKYKQTRTFTFKEILRRDVFHPGIKYLYGKHCPGYAEILPLTSGIPIQDEMKNAPASYKRNNKFMKK